MAKKSKVEIESFKQESTQFAQQDIGQISPAYYLWFADPKVQLEKISGRGLSSESFLDLLKLKADEKFIAALDRRHEKRLEIRYGCVDCHSGANRIGPRLEFLAEWKKGQGLSEDTLNFVGDVLQKNNHKPFAMPFGRRPLTIGEMEEFKQYLRRKP